MFPNMYSTPKKHKYVHNKATGERYVISVIKKGQRVASGKNSNASTSASASASNTSVQKSSQQSMPVFAQQSNGSASNSQRATFHRRDFTNTTPFGTTRYTETTGTFSNNTNWKGGNMGVFNPR